MRYPNTTTTDGGSADIASLHRCNLVRQCRSNCRGAIICAYVLYICIVLLTSSRPTWRWGVRKMHGAIFSRSTWQGLFLQSCCISSMQGGQMWQVQKRQGAIFHHRHIVAKHHRGDDLINIALTRFANKKAL